MRRFRLLILAIMLSSCPLAWAQDDGFLMEVGLGGGGSFYMGDANSRLYSGTNGMVSALVRYNINPRFSLKANLSAAGISGDTNMADGVLPGDRIKFSRTLYDLGFQVEWGFCAFGTTNWNGISRIAPYGLLGAGLTFAPQPEQNDFAANFPIGLGVRYKLSDRVNLGLEWTMRFSTSDRLDVTGNGSPSLNDPFMIKGKGIKNKDRYSFTMLYVTFDVFKRPCNCNDETVK